MRLPVYLQVPSPLPTRNQPPSRVDGSSGRLTVVTMRARPVLAGAMLAVALSGLYVTTVVSGPNGHRAGGPSADDVAEVLNCQGSASAELCVAATAESIRSRSGLLAALSALREAFAHGTLPVNCHTTLHQFGTVVGADIGIEAVVAGGGFCEGGFYHGIIAETGDTSGTAQRCTELPGSESYSCWHGVGHAAYTLGVVAGLELCRSGGGDYTEKCWAGLFMEHVEARQGPETLAEYCADATDDAFRSCANSVVGTVAFHEPERALGWCAEYAERLYDNSLCYFRVGGGVGSSAVSESRDLEVLRDQALKICGSSSFCHLGVIRGAVSVTQDRQLGIALCGKLPLAEAEQVACGQVVENVVSVTAK